MGLPVIAHGYVVGVGMSSAATTDEVHALLNETLLSEHIELCDVKAVATHERFVCDARLVALGPPILGFSAVRLAGVDVPSPSGAVHLATGTASVAEAAALLASATGATLVMHKQRSAHVTIAIARSCSGRIDR